MNKKVYDVLTISRYVINKCNRENIIISNLKLQKLLYLIQGFYLAFYHQRCFDDDIQAWDYGPVCPNAYHEFKRFGANNIPTINFYEEIYFEDGTIKCKKHEFNNDEIDQDTRDIINAVIETYGHYSATSLVNITHAQLPWNKTYYSHPSEKNVIIDEKLIEEYFSGLINNG